MRFLCLYRPGTPENETPPSDEERAAMGALISDMAKAGVLLGTEGCKSSRFGARVQLEGGVYSVTDGPFPETKELICGICLLQVKSHAEAVEWTKRFLSVVKHGTTEIRQLYDVPAA